MDIRIRLRPWLESRLNEGWIPGLRWVDKENSMFRIPWKHHSKHTWSEDDAVIFKDWAVVTGRHREGIDTADWPMWKTRLRCALNKAPDIQEVKQRHSLHSDEPFKVYRFISKTESLWRANACRNASMVFDGIPAAGAVISSSVSSAHHLQIPSSPNQQQIRKNYGLSGIGLGKLTNNPTIFIRRSSTGTGVVTTRPITLIQRGMEGEVFVKQMCLPVSSLHNAINNSGDSSLVDNNGISSLDQGTSGASSSHHQFALAGSDQLDIGANQEVDGNPSSRLTSDFDSNNGSGASGSGVVIRSVSFANQEVQSPSVFRRVVSLPGNSGAISPGNGGVVTTAGGPSLPFLPDIMEPELHQLCLRILHLDIKVKDTIITNPNGCCIYYGRYDETDSPSAPEPHEPPIAQFVSEKNKPYVDLLLDNMQRGIILTVSYGSIYAERLCKCAIFVYMVTSDGSEFQLTHKLCRREREKIFDYDQFFEDLDFYKIGQRPKPQFEVILAFGQQLKPGLTTEGLLVWCRVANCKAWFALQRMQGLPYNMNPRQSMIGAVSSHVKYEDSDIPIADEEQVIEEGVEIPLEEDALYDQNDDEDIKYSGC